MAPVQKAPLLIEDSPATKEIQAPPEINAPSGWALTGMMFSMITKTVSTFLGAMAFKKLMGETVDNVKSKVVQWWTERQERIWKIQNMENLVDGVDFHELSPEEEYARRLEYETLWEEQYNEELKNQQSQ